MPSSSAAPDPSTALVEGRIGHLRRRIYRLLELSGGEFAGRIVNASILLLIVANVVAVILESEQEIESAYHDFFRAFEWVSVTVFTIEYIVRAWVAVEDARYADPVRGRLRYLLTPMAIVDLIAILPTLLMAFTQIDTRILRVLRLFRIFKLTRHFSALEILFRVIRAELRTLGAALFIMFVLAILASAGMYAAERNVQPDAFGSIPRAMWWATVTLTTVGYGDVVPQTETGRLFSGLIVILGIGIAALPAGIIAGGFAREFQRRSEVFRIVAKEAVRDGVIDESERELLESTRQELALDSEEADLLLAEARQRREEIEAITHCPHCGKPLVTSDVPADGA